jgi:hypothetical protein
MQFDYGVGANQAQKLDVKGSFFKMVTGTGKVRVTTDKGESIDLLPGQGVWGVDFNWLSVKDRTGANNAGTILAGSFDYRDDRISGTVDVLDGGKARTLANMAFIGGASCPNGASVYAKTQLWNPAGSGKRLIVSSITVMATVSAGLIQARSSTAKLSVTEATPAPNSKLLGGAPSLVAVMCHEQNAALTDPLLSGATVNVNVPYTMQFKEPVIVTPGTGLTVNGTINQDLVAYYEYIEEAIQ